MEDEKRTCPMDFMSCFIFQRVPFLTHIIILCIACAGPSLCPQFFSTLVFVLHLILLITNVQSAWGAYCAWRGVAQCHATDWYAVWQNRRSNRDVAEEKSCEGGRARPHFSKVIHVIIVPAYKEDPVILHETISVLESHPSAKTNFRICLAMEKRETGSEESARNLVKDFSSSFLEITYSLHTEGISGESNGKSSNVNCAVRTMAHRHPLEHPHTILTIIDSDTLLGQSYFDCATAKFCLASSEERAMMMFAVPILFDRNSDNIPILVKVTDMMWSIAGMGAIYESSWCKIPTSAYGMSMELAVNVDFWDVGPEAIGEDMHMTLKCFLSTGGRLRVETVYSPASQMNVVGEHHGVGFRGYWSDLKARYRQAIRHMWGSLDFGYALRRIISGDFGELSHRDQEHSYRQNGSSWVSGSEMPNDRIPERESAKRHNPTLLGSAIWSFNVLCSLFTVNLLRRNCSRLISGIKKWADVNAWRRCARIATLMLRLFQAHIMLGWLFVFVVVTKVMPAIGTTWKTILFLISHNEFLPWEYMFSDRGTDALALSYSRVVMFPSLDLSLGMHSMNWSEFCQHFALVVRNSSALLLLVTFVFYAKYHEIGTACRKRSSPRQRSTWYEQMRIALDVIIHMSALPGAVFFGVFPLLHAQGLQLFTRHLIYTVSLKVTMTKESILPISLSQDLDDNTRLAMSTTKWKQ